MKCIFNRPIHHHPLYLSGARTRGLWVRGGRSDKEAKGFNLWPQSPEYLLRQGSEVYLHSNYQLASVTHPVELFYLLSVGLFQYTSTTVSTTVWQMSHIVFGWPSQGVLSLSQKPIQQAPRQWTPLSGPFLDPPLPPSHLQKPHEGCCTSMKAVEMCRITRYQHQRSKLMNKGTYRMERNILAYTD